MFHILSIFLYSSFDVAEEEVYVDQNVENNNAQPSPRVKRKRSKSGGGCYDFREHGIDARRRGSKHQRRKQNCNFLLINTIIL